MNASVNAPMNATATIDRPRMLDGIVPRPRAWHGPDVADAEFVVKLTPECLAELDQVVAEQRKAPVPTLILVPEHFELSACRRMMQGACTWSSL